MRIVFVIISLLAILPAASRAAIFECTQNAYATRDYTTFNDLNKWCAGVGCKNGELFQVTPTASFKSLEHRKYILSLNKKDAPVLKIIRSINEDGETATEEIRLKVASKDPQSDALLMTYVSAMGNQLFSIILSPKLKKMVANEVSFVQGVRGNSRTFDCQ